MTISSLPDLIVLLTQPIIILIHLSGYDIPEQSSSGYAYVYNVLNFPPFESKCVARKSKINWRIGTIWLENLFTSTNYNFGEPDKISSWKSKSCGTFAWDDQIGKSRKTFSINLQVMPTDSQWLGASQPSAPGGLGSQHWSVTTKMQKLQLLFSLWQWFSRICYTICLFQKLESKHVVKRSTLK